MLDPDDLTVLLGGLIAVDDHRTRSIVAANCTIVADSIHKNSNKYQH
jgi:hypothetical protein